MSELMYITESSDILPKEILLIIENISSSLSDAYLEYIIYKHQAIQVLVDKLPCFEFLHCDVKTIWNWCETNTVYITYMRGDNVLRRNFPTYQDIIDCDDEDKIISCMIEMYMDMISHTSYMNMITTMWKSEYVYGIEVKLPSLEYYFVNFLLTERMHFYNRFLEVWIVIIAIVYNKNFVTVIYNIIHNTPGDFSDE